MKTQARGIVLCALALLAAVLCLSASEGDKGAVPLVYDQNKYICDSPVAFPFRVDSGEVGEFRVSANGKLFVVFYDVITSEGWDFYLARYQRNGARAGAPILVASEGLYSQPSNLAIRWDGGEYSVFYSTNDDAGEGIHHLRLDESGNPRGENLVVARSDYSDKPSLPAFFDGGSAIAWRLDSGTIRLFTFKPGFDGSVATYDTGIKGRDPSVTRQGDGYAMLYAIEDGAGEALALATLGPTGRPTGKPLSGFDRGIASEKGETKPSQIRVVESGGSLYAAWLMGHRLCIASFTAQSRVAGRAAKSVRLGEKVVAIALFSDAWGPRALVERFCGPPPYPSDNDWDGSTFPSRGIDLLGVGDLGRPNSTTICDNIEFSPYMFEIEALPFADRLCLFCYRPGNDFIMLVSIDDKGNIL